MENNNTIREKAYCVILAGGKGRRLWPCSREELPKQFLDFFGTGRTQLQQTYDRFATFLPHENIFVNTNQHYMDIVRQQLPDLSDDNIMAEPIHRNTAPSVAWACHRVLKYNRDALLIVSPSDQDVHDEEAFRQNMMEGLSFIADNDGLLTMGVRPTRPEPGYGYIQLGNHLGDNLFSVQSFTEKPEREFARMFVESEEFYWNTGLFLSRASYLQKTFMELLPNVLRRLDAINPGSTIEEENEFIRQNFPAYPNLSIDHSILERSKNVFVMRCNFGWADLGTWHSIHEAYSRTADDNVVVNSDVILNNAHNNIIKLPKDRLAIINGLDGFIVAEHDNVLLICPKEDSSALIRKYITEVQMKKGNEYI